MNLVAWHSKSHSLAYIVRREKVKHRIEHLKSIEHFIFHLNSSVEHSTTGTQQTSTMSPPVTSNQSWWLSTRVLVAFLSLLGTAIMYITRVNLNIAILSMTKKEMIVELIGETNRTVTTVVGDFDWGPSEQGIILGSFFYGKLSSDSFNDHMIN